MRLKYVSQKTLTLFTTKDKFDESLADKIFNKYLNVDDLNTIDRLFYGKSTKIGSYKSQSGWQDFAKICIAYLSPNDFNYVITMAISERLHVVKRSFSEPTPLRHFFDNESLALVMFDFYLAHFDVMAKLDKIAARYGELINKNSSEQYQAEINALQTQFKTLLMPVWFPFKCAQLPSEVFQEEILMRSCQQLNFSLLLSDVLSCQEQPTFSNYPRGFSNQVDARRRMNAALKLSPSEQVLHWYARHGQKLDQALRVSSVVMLGLLLMTIISGVGFAVMFAASAIFAAVGLGMMIAYGVSRFRVHREPNAHIESKQHFDERPESEQDVLSESTLLMMRALPSTRPPQPVALVVEQSPAAAPEVITEMLVMPEAPVFTP